MLRHIFIILVAVNLLTAVFAFNCITCDSSEPKCTSNPASIAPSNCDSKICYTKIDKGVLSRGCIGTPTSVTAASCTAENNCVQCTTENCNAAQTVCQTCNSGTDPACAQLTSINVNYNTVCSETNAQCYVGLDGVNTVRRCATTADTNCAPTNTAVVGVTCQLCNGANCNNQLYPQDRLKCYHCAANTADASCNNPTAQGTTQSAIACQNYKTDDRCFTYGKSATTMVRGCVSDTDSTLCGTTNTDTACATCGTNACNKNQYTYQPSLECIQCNSKDQTTCATQQDVKTAKSCPEISYTAKPNCYLQVKDGVATRACGNCPDSAGCTACDTLNGCNNAALNIKTTIECIQCRTDINANCSKDATGLSTISCSNSQCYGIKWENIFVRGCLANAVREVQLICADPNKNQCITCNTDKCNVEPSGGGAGMNTLHTGLLILIALAATLKQLV